MEQETGGTHLHFIGTRRSDLKKSFMVAVRSLLTSCSREEFKNAFPNFTNAEQQRLHQLFIQVVTSLHVNIEVGKILDTVEQHVEEQSLHPLFSDKTNIGNVVRNFSTAKETEIQLLRARLEKAEEKCFLSKLVLINLRKEQKKCWGQQSC